MFNPTTRIWTVQKGDWLTKIAQHVYCSESYWNLIAHANKQKVDNYNFERYAKGKYNVITVGQELYCPRVNGSTLSAVRATGDYTLVIDGKEIILVSNLNCEVVLNGVVRNLSFTLPYSEVNASYKQNDSVKLYIKNTLVLDGFLVKPTPTFEKENGDSISWSGITASSDITKSNYNFTKNESASFKNISLSTLCKKILKDFPISVTFQNNNDANLNIKKATIDIGDTIFDFLQGIMEKNGIILHGLHDGNLLAFKNDVFSKKVVKFFDETESISPMYNYEELAKTYRCIENKTKGGASVEVSNNLVTREILRIVRKDDNFQGGLLAFANHFMAKQFANAFSISVTDMGFVDGDGDVWAVNNMIKAYSKSIGFGEPRNFLINSVRYEVAKDRLSTTLQAVLPQSRSNEMVTSLPFLG